MTNCPMASIDEYDDISTKNEYANALADGCSEAEAMKACYRFSRDNARTPMHWDDSPNAGFTTGKPWLKVNPNYRDLNVAAQEKQKESVLNYYKKLIALRKSPQYREVFTYGDFQPVFEEETDLLAYCRCMNGTDVIVIANFASEDKTVKMDNLMNRQILLSNADVALRDSSLTLQPAQVVVLG